MTDLHDLVVSYLFVSISGVIIIGVVCLIGEFIHELVKSI